MYFNKTIPELDVTNLDAAIKFYSTCGFKVEYERKEDKFVFMSLGEIQFMFCELKDINKWETGKLEYPFGRGINFQLEVDNVDTIYNSLKANGYEIMVEIENVDEVYTNLIKGNYPIMLEIEENWYRKDNKLLGSKEFLVQDPDGYLLRFAEDLGSKDE